MVWAKIILPSAAAMMETNVRLHMTFFSLFEHGWMDKQTSYLKAET
jgi:hypothetical protein